MSTVDQSSDHCKRIIVDESVSANLHSASLPFIIKKAFLCFNVDGLTVDNCWLNLHVFSVMISAVGEVLVTETKLTRKIPETVKQMKIHL